MRAGLSSTHLENRMIGSPITAAQVQRGALIDFIPDPIVTARYVSVDKPTPSQYTLLAFAEIMVEEILDTEDIAMSRGEWKKQIKHTHGAHIGEEY